MQTSETISPELIPFATAAEAPEILDQTITLARREESGRAFSLSFILSRQPTIAEDDVTHLIQGALYAFTMRVPPLLGLPECEVALVVLEARRIVGRAPIEDGQATLRGLFGKQEALFFLRAAMGMDSPLTLMVCRSDSRAPLMTLDLGEFLKREFAGLTLDALVRLTTYGEDGTTLACVPPRSTESKQRAANPIIPVLAAEQHVSLYRAALPLARPQLLAAAHSVATATPLTAMPVAVAALAHLSVLGFVQQPENLPLVDGAERIFPSAVDSRQCLYIPEFTVIAPQPAAPVRSAPFSFIFESKGFDSSGLPSIDATILFSLSITTPAALQQVMGDRQYQRSSEITVEQWYAHLLLPYRDSSGVVTYHAAPATVNRSGDVLTVVVALQDAWARLAYGALALSQTTESPRLVVRLDYEGYTRRQNLRLAEAWNRKATLLPTVSLIGGSRDARGEPPTIEVALPQGALRIRKEEMNLERRPSALTAVALHPEIISLETPSSAPAKDLIKRMFQAESSVPVSFPCESYGSFYVRSEDGQDSAVGCTTTLSLGQKPLALYQLVSQTVLPSGRGALYRSLQQPSRFMVVPAAYRITRFGPEDGDKAYRPAVYLFSVLDAENAAQNQSCCLVTLVPDITDIEYQRIGELLRSLSSNPSLITIAEELASPSFTWALPPSVTALSVVSGHAVQVTFSTDLTGTLLLEQMLRSTGVLGQARFVLSDGTPFTVNIDVNLQHVVGPAVEARMSESTIMLKNHVAHAVEFSAVHLVSDSTIINSIPCSVTLRSGDSTSVASPSTPSTLTPIPEFRIVAAAGESLTELRCFVEDIRLGLTVINLVNFANHGVTEITMVCTLDGVPKSESLTFGPNDTSQSLQWTLPLTAFVTSRTVSYRVIITLGDGTKLEKGPKVWNLDDDGSVLSLAWNELQ